MKKIFLLIILTILISTSKNTHAQIGKQIAISLAIPDMSASSVPFDGKLGWGFGYNVFAKYSERAEWTSGIGVTTGKYTNTYYEENTSGIIAEATNTINFNMLTVMYQMTYYAIPDKLGVFGGLIGGMSFSSSSDIYSNDIISKSPNSIAGKSTSGSEWDALSQSDDILFNPEYTASIFQFGLKFGLSYTIAERFVAFADYNFFLTNYFENDSKLNDFLGGPNQRILSVGLAYKFLPNVAKKRF